MKISDKDYKITPIEPFGVIVESNSGLLSVFQLDQLLVKDLFAKHNLVVLRGFKTFKGSVEFAEYCEKWGEISEWPFGKVLELLEQDSSQDHIFDNSYVPLHWDGMYRPQIPEYQIFHCVVSPPKGKGGRTTFSNTLLALKNASTEDIELWSRVTGDYQREMEFYKSKTVSPIITRHPYRNELVIRYNEPPVQSKGEFVNPPVLEFRGLDRGELPEFHQGLMSQLYSQNCFYAHEWEDRDIVIADNFSLLHGRESFEARSPRHLQRVHVLSEVPYNNPGLEYHQ